jgi:hypothetical protein
MPKSYWLQLHVEPVWKESVITASGGSCLQIITVSRTAKLLSPAVLPDVGGSGDIDP